MTYQRSRATVCLPISPALQGGDVADEVVNICALKQIFFYYQTRILKHHYSSLRMLILNKTIFSDYLAFADSIRVPLVRSCLASLLILILSLLPLTSQAQNSNSASTKVNTWQMDIGFGVLHSQSASHLKPRGSFLSSSQALPLNNLQANAPTIEQQLLLPNFTLKYNDTQGHWSLGPAPGFRFGINRQQSSDFATMKFSAGYDAPDYYADLYSTNGRSITDSSVYGINIDVQPKSLQYASTSLGFSAKWLQLKLGKDLTTTIINAQGQQGDLGRSGQQFHYTAKVKFGLITLSYALAQFTAEGKADSSQSTHLGANLVIPFLPPFFFIMNYQSQFDDYLKTHPLFNTKRHDHNQSFSLIINYKLNQQQKITLLHSQKRSDSNINFFNKTTSVTSLFYAYTFNWD